MARDTTVFPEKIPLAIANLAWDGDPLHTETQGLFFEWTEGVIRALASHGFFNYVRSTDAPVSPIANTVWIKPMVWDAATKTITAEADIKIRNEANTAWEAPNKDRWARATGVSGALHWDGIDGIPATFPPAEHTHSGYAPTSHTHSEYASNSHTHNGFAATSHSHGEYASSSHSHSEYAPVTHGHNGYANSVHSHSEYATASHTHSGFAPINHAHAGYDTHAAHLYHGGQPNNGYLYYSSSNYSSSDTQNEFFEYRSNGVLIKKAGYYWVNLLTAASKLTAAGVNAGTIAFSLYNMTNSQSLGVANLHNMGWWKQVGSTWDRSPISGLIYLPANAIVGMYVSGNDGTAESKVSQITLLKLGSST